jgi:hypothetical protein
MRFLPARPKPASRETPRPGPFPFKNKGFEFYKHPPAQAYTLNKFLYEVRTDSQMRRRVINDYDTVATEWGLSAEEKEAARALVAVKDAKVVSDFCAPLVKAGVHPLQALMTLHVIYGDHRRMRQASQN